MISPGDHERFARLLERHRRFLLTTHMNCDGDAIGSQTALARFLLDHDCEIRIVNQDPTPHNLAFLDAGDLRREVYDPAVHDTALETYDRIVLLDNSAADRFGRMETKLLRVADRTLCIDHHPTRGTPWADNILDVDACATAAMVYELATATGWKPAREAAEALYVGIATDTGFFRFNSTNVQAHRISAILLGSGVDPARCYREIYERNSPEYIRLLGMALADLRADAGGSILSLRITRGMLDAVGAKNVDTSEMTTLLLATDGVRLALLFRELEEDRVKVSLRSKGVLDVHRLAGGFGGGGHRNASGIVLQGTLDDAVKRVIARARELVSETPG